MIKKLGSGRRQSVSTDRSGFSVWDRAKSFEEIGMDIVVTLARVAVAGVFLVAAVAKFRSCSATMTAMADFGVPEKVTSQAAIVIPITEATMAGLLLIPQTTAIAAAGLAALLVAFTVGMLRPFAQRRSVSCRCFGPLTSGSIGPTSIARNIVLLAATLFIAANTSSGRTRLDVRWTGVIVIGGLGILLVLAFVVWAMSKRGSQAANTSTMGGPIAAPPFVLPSTDGRVIRLTDLVTTDRAVLLIFTDVHCPVCRALSVRVRDWECQIGADLRIVLVNNGDLDTAAAEAEALGIQTILVQERHEVARQYGVRLTPTATLVLPDLTVQLPLLEGAEDIDAFMLAITRDRDEQQVTGTQTAGSGRNLQPLALGLNG